MNYTPRPWKVVRRGTVGDFSILGTEFVSGEAQTTHTAGIAFDILHEADAHLIAAAPAMYEALKKLAELQRKWRSDDEAETIDSIEYMDEIDKILWSDIIAQAEGK